MRLILTIVFNALIVPNQIYQDYIVEKIYYISNNPKKQYRLLKRNALQTPPLTELKASELSKAIFYRY